MRDPKTITLSEAILAYKDAVDTGNKAAQALLEAAAQGDADKLAEVAKHLETLKKRKK